MNIKIDTLAVKRGKTNINFFIKDFVRDIDYFKII